MQIFNPSAAYVGEGHIFIPPSAYYQIGQGTWSELAGAPTYFLLFSNDATKALYDNVKYYLYLASGTYTVRVTFVTGTDAAQVNIERPNGSNIGTQETYDAGATSIITKTITGHSVSTSGLTTLTIIAAGKNAGSTAYAVRIKTISLWRTT